MNANDVISYEPLTSGDHKTGVLTVSKETTIYNDYGKAQTNRKLAANTSWKTDRRAVIDGHVMYRISTDMWVRADDADTLTLNVANVK